MLVEEFLADIGVDLAQIGRDGYGKGLHHRFSIEQLSIIET